MTKLSLLLGTKATIKSLEMAGLLHDRPLLRLFYRTSEVAAGILYTQAPRFYGHLMEQPHRWVGRRSPFPER